MDKKALKKISFEVPAYLVEALQKARKLGRKYKGRKFSNGLACEIGMKILLEINEDEEEDVIDQKLEDNEIQDNFLKSQRHVLLELKKKKQAEKKEREVESLKNEQDNERVALKIQEHWEQITVMQDKQAIGYIVNVVPTKLTKEKVAAVFPRGFAPTPTKEEALQIAASLLNDIEGI
jgi:hypothetical protein